MILQVFRAKWDALKQAHGLFYCRQGLRELQIVVNSIESNPRCEPDSETRTLAATKSFFSEIHSTSWLFDTFKWLEEKANLILVDTIWYKVDTELTLGSG